MEFGDIVFYIVIAIIILSNFFKKAKKPGKPDAEEKPAQKSGWKKTLEEMLENLQKEMEQKPAPEPDDIFVKQKTGWEDIVSDEERETIRQKKESSRARAEEVPSRSVDPVDFNGPAARKHQQQKAGRRADKKRDYKGLETDDQYRFIAPLISGRRDLRELSQRDLQNAVVWSEILGSPLGLRDLEG